MFVSSSQLEQNMVTNINKEEEELPRLDKCSIASNEYGGGKAVRFTDTVIITATGGKVSPKVEEEEKSQKGGNHRIRTNMLLFFGWVIWENDCPDTVVRMNGGEAQAAVKEGKAYGEKSNNKYDEDSMLDSMLDKMFHAKRRRDDDKKSLIPTMIEYESDATPGTDATPRTTTASISSLFFSPCMHMLAIFSLLLVVGLLPILTRTALHFRNKNNKNTNNRPSLMPTSSISPKMNEDVLRIRSFLQFYYLTQEEFSPSSPQERAVDWIIHQDNVSQFPTTGNGVKALLQRWILAVFAFTTQHEHWHACGAPPQSSSSPPDPLLLNMNKTTACHVDVLDLSTDESISNTYYYWLSHDHECTWYGVTCDENGSVVRLELPENNLNGTIPGELIHLTSLRILHLQHNLLSGTLPTHIAHLYPLIELQLLDNMFSGTIPEELYDLTTLQKLSLGWNDFSGTLSTRIGEMTNLQMLSLFDNKFDGTIPSEIGKLSFLSFLYTHSNAFTGTIPNEISNLSMLRQWKHFENINTGTLPNDIGNLTNLEILWLSECRFSGPLPPSFYNLTRLQQFHAWNNRDLFQEPFSTGFNGTISSEIGNMKELTSFVVNHNWFQGELPWEFGDLIKLKTVFLHFNDIMGESPFCDEDMPNITRQQQYLTVEMDCLVENNNEAKVNCTCCSACCSYYNGICRE